MPQDYKVRNAVLTLDGTAQSLLAAWGTVGPANPIGGPNDLACEIIFVQPDGANAAAIFLGGSGVTVTDGIRVEPAATGVPPAPFRIEAYTARVKPSNIYVIGTSTQKVRVMLIAY